MEINILWGFFRIFFVFLAFLWQYVEIIMHWIYIDYHKRVFLPLVFLFFPPMAVAYEMLFLKRPFLVALDLQLEQFLLYVLALASAWIIGYWKLRKKGMWDTRVNFLDEFFRQMNASTRSSNEDYRREP